MLPPCVTLFVLVNVVSVMSEYEDSPRGDMGGWEVRSEEMVSRASELALTFPRMVLMLIIAMRMHSMRVAGCLR